jgi:hypothetical protein
VVPLSPNPSFRTKLFFGKFALSERREPKGASLIYPTGWCTYMLLCIDGSCYIGRTNDPFRRIHDHAYKVCLSERSSRFTDATVAA